jgi:AbiV family abortive infection protein
MRGATDMDLDIDKLIIRPGHFVLSPDKRYRIAGDERTETLNIFEGKEAAAKAYAAYVNCHNNAVDLISDAEILYQAGKFARSFALAITAWEELGKSQIAADYHSGLLSEKEYKAAFKEHRVNTSYLNRAGAIDGKKFLTVAHNSTLGHRLEDARQTALYASAENMPREAIDQENSKEIIDRVNEHIHYIRFAEEFNGRIGSKALFK